MRPRDEQKQSRIYESAINLINELGFDGASVAKIAQQAEVSPATIYCYFENKQDMLNKLFLSLCEELGGRFLTLLSNDEQVQEGLRKVWYDLYHHAQESPAHFRFLEQFCNCPMIHQVSQDQAQNYFAPVNRLYEQGRTNAIIKPMANEVLDAHFFFPLIQLLKLQFNQRILLTPERLKQSYRASWDAIKAT
ncbi:MAG: TetR/AcrR family transcriptional regulator [Hahellaceae bacterium]|nr:TetR/AcrR family transcriptional regulator [Hahellaceae bacterium]MCP5169627.1 TetR/AcrR family transcriptional regulator [Hahellaceae bacterium]